MLYNLRKISRYHPRPCTFISALVVLGSLFATPHLLLAQGTSCSNAENIVLATSGVTTSLRTLGASARHFFRITTPSQGTLTVSTEGSTNTTGILSGPDGLEIGRDVETGEEANFLLSRQLQAGMYCLEVQGDTLTTAGDYRLVVQGDFVDDDHGVGCDSATVVETNPAQPVLIPGALSVHGDQDFFRIRIPAGGGRLTVSTEGGTNTTGILSGPDGLEIESNAGDADDANFRLSRQLPAGEYCVQVRGDTPGVLGSYTFRLDGAFTGDDHGVSCATASVVRRGTAAAARIDGTLSVYGDADFFQVQIAEGGGSLTVETEGGINTTGILFGPDGSEIERDTDDGEGTNFRISRQLAAGLYCVEVQGESLTTTGSYRLRVEGAFIDITSTLVTAVLPSSRSVQVGTPATAFATMINTSRDLAVGCAPAPPPNLPATFTFQTTNPATNQITGTPDTPVDIPAGAAQSFVFAFTPTGSLMPTEVLLTFDCANTTPALSTPGLNTLLLTASATPVPDIVALAATLTNDGVARIPGDAGTGVFAVATVNVGAAGAITAMVDTGGVTLPVVLTICETSPTTGACVSSPASSVTTQINANATPTFGVFVRGTGRVSFNPAQHRTFVRFTDAQGVTRGATSVAVQTQ